jgi:hypothetical protein
LRTRRPSHHTAQKGLVITLLDIGMSRGVGACIVIRARLSTSIGYSRNIGAYGRRRSLLLQGHRSSWGGTGLWWVKVGWLLWLLVRIAVFIVLGSLTPYPSCQTTNSDCTNGDQRYPITEEGLTAVVPYRGRRRWVQWTIARCRCFALCLIEHVGGLHW